MTTYLILARHGPKDHDSDKLDRRKRLKDDGKEVREVASILAETLSVQFQNESDRIVIGQLWHGAHKAVRQTGGILLDTLLNYGISLDDDQVESKPELDPECFWKAETRKDRHKLGALLIEQLKKLSTKEDTLPPGSNAILLVGHQPQLGWITESVMGEPVPIGRSEIVCLAINDSGIDWLFRNARWLISPMGWLRIRARWLLWAISPRDTEAIQQLREKVKSKMQVAGALGGLITFFLGLMLRWLLDPDTMKNLSSDAARTSLKAATVLFLCGLALYLAAFYAYDRLLMPIRYWGESASPNRRRWLVCRPPSPANWILYQNMIRVWTWLFTPATLAVIAGLLALVYAVFEPPLIIWAVFAVLAAVFYLIYHFLLRPALGTED